MQPPRVLPVVLDISGFLHTFPQDHPFYKDAQGQEPARSLLHRCSGTRSPACCRLRALVAKHAAVGTGFWRTRCLFPPQQLTNAACNVLKTALLVQFFWSPCTFLALWEGRAGGGCAGCNFWSPPLQVSSLPLPAARSCSMVFQQGGCAERPCAGKGQAQRCAGRPCQDWLCQQLRFGFQAVILGGEGRWWLLLAQVVCE